MSECIKATVVTDLSRENRVYQLPPRIDICHGYNKIIGAISISYKPNGWPINRIESDTIVAEYVSAKLKDNINHIKHCNLLLFLTTDWLLNNRINAYKKLWKKIQIENEFCTLKYDPYKEYMFSHGDKIAFAGFAKIEVDDLPFITLLLRKYYGRSFVLLSSKGVDYTSHDIEVLFEEGFNYSQSMLANWDNIIYHCCCQEDIVIKLAPIVDWPPESAFESALDIFMHSDQIETYRCLFQ